MIPKQMFYFICVFIASLFTCILGFDDHPFPTLDNEIYIQTATVYNKAIVIAAIVIAVIDLVSLIFGICMIMIFGRKKVIHGRILSMPLQRQQVIGNQEFVPPLMVCSPDMPPQETSLGPSPTTTQYDYSSGPQKEFPPPAYNSNSNWKTFN